MKLITRLAALLLILGMNVPTGANAGALPVDPAPIAESLTVPAGSDQTADDLAVPPAPPAGPSNTVQPPEIVTGETVDWFTVGGGFLYYGANCQKPSEAVSGADGYVRRVPVRGGATELLKNAPRGGCDLSVNQIDVTADDNGVYYYNVLRQTVERIKPFAPFDRVDIYTVANIPAGSIDIDNGFLIWGQGNSLYKVNKLDGSNFCYIAVVPGTISDIAAYGGTVAWLSNGHLYERSEDCVAATPKDLGAASGSSLIATPYSTGTFFSGTRYEYAWIQGNLIRRYSCARASIAACGMATLYTAPTSPAYYLANLGFDTNRIFWAENYNEGAPGGFASPSIHGELHRITLGVAGDDVIDAYRNDRDYLFSVYTNDAMFNAAGSGYVYYFVTQFNSATGALERRLARKRADAPPVPTELEISGWEVTQGLQNLNNDLPFVAKKPTFVRVYGRIVSGPRKNAVEVFLYGRRNGISMSPAVIGSLGGPRRITFSSIEDRTVGSSGWLFQLPDSWVSGGAVAIEARIALRDYSYVANPAKQIKSLTPDFVSKAPICLVAIPVRTNAPAASLSDPAYYQMMQIAKQLLPTSDFWLYQQSSDVAELEARFGIPPWEYGPYEIPDDSDKVLRALGMREDFTDDPDRCDDVDAITHYLGLVNWQTDTSVGDGALETGKGERPGSELYVKLAPPMALTNPSWQTNSLRTLGHELGHNYGRQHVACSDGAAVPAGTDGGYPYIDPDGTACKFDNRPLGAPTTYIGFDVLTQQPILPSAWADFMSYSAGSWYSDYTWRGIFGAVQNHSFALAAPLDAVSSQSAGDIVYVSGAISPTGAVLDTAWVRPAASLGQSVRRKLASLSAGDVTAQADPVRVQLLDPSGNILSDQPVSLDGVVDDGPPAARNFTASFPAPSGAVAKIQIVQGGNVLALATPGAATPTVSIASPAGGEIVGDSLTVSFAASDADAADKLLFTVEYSRDDGAHWQVLGANLSARSASAFSSFVFDSLGGLPASTTGGRIRVLVSDGYHTGSAVSNQFTVTNRAPQPAITRPATGQVLPAGQTVTLSGQATDPEDGGLSGASLHWQLNGVDAGTGELLNVSGLAPGAYTAALIATDGQGGSATATRTFTIAPLVVPSGFTPTLDGRCDDPEYDFARQVALAPYASGSQVSALLQRTDTDLWVCFDGLLHGASGATARAGIRIDTDASGDANAGPGDIGLFITENGSPVVEIGDGAGGYTSKEISGFSARNDGLLSAGPDGSVRWTAELQIPLSAIGGAGHLTKLDLVHQNVASTGNDFHWPYKATNVSPATWGLAAFGDLPTLTAISPSTSAAPSAAFTLAVTGTNFLSNDVVRWGTTALSTTFKSVNRLEAAVPADLLVTAGVFPVSVVAPGFESVPTASLPYILTSQKPALTSGNLPGGPSSQLTLTGEHFEPGATAVWNGVPLATTVQSATSATASVPSSLIPYSGTADVVITNPYSGASNKLAIPFSASYSSFLPATSVNRSPS